MRASFGASLSKPLQVTRFRTLARNRQNGFVGYLFDFPGTRWRNQLTRP